jgi:hypothetical protein
MIPERRKRKAKEAGQSPGDIPDRQNRRFRHAEILLGVATA